jgi:hypothetical protein
MRPQNPRRHDAATVTSQMLQELPLQLLRRGWHKLGVSAGGHGEANCKELKFQRDFGYMYILHMHAQYW